MKKLIWGSLSLVLALALASCSSSGSVSMMAKCDSCHKQVAQDRICPTCHVCLKCCRCTAKCAKCGKEVSLRTEMCGKCHKLCLACDTCQ